MTANQSIKPIYSAIQQQQPSQQLTSPQMRRSAERVEMARKAAKKILISYPDYGKAPPEYAVMLAEFMSFLTEEEIAAVMDPRHGVTTKTEFLPTNKHIKEVVDEYHERKRKFAPSTSGYQRFESVVTEKDVRPDKTPFRPFPKLWEVFADEPWLLKSHTFETLCEASRSLAMFGKDASRDVLARRVGA